LGIPLAGGKGKAGFGRLFERELEVI